MERLEIQQMINKSIEDYASKAMFGVAKVPAHTHNGVDSSKIHAVDILGLSGSRYASSFGSFTGGTGDQSFTCGFKPNYLIIQALPAGNYLSSSYGTKVANEISSCLFQYSNGGNLTSSTDNSAIVVIWDNSLTTNTLASFVSFDPTGFTLNWSADAIDINYLWQAYI